MTSEQMSPMPAPLDHKLTPEQQAEIDKRKLFEDRLQACYALRKAKIRPEDVMPDSYEQGRLIRRFLNPKLSQAFRAWFEELDKSGDNLILDYLMAHTEDEIIEMKDMDPILAVLEESRRRSRTLH